MCIADVSRRVGGFAAGYTLYKAIATPDSYGGRSIEAKLAKDKYVLFSCFECLHIVVYEKTIRVY